MSSSKFSGGKPAVKHKKQSSGGCLPFSIEAMESRRLLSAAVGDVLSNSTALFSDRHQVRPQLHQSISYLPEDGISPAQIKKTYGLDKVSGDGTGQTIAIIDAYHHPNIVSDLKTFSRQFSLPDPPTFNIVSQTGGSVSKIKVNAGWASETALDVEWTHAISPGSNLLLVESVNDDLSNLIKAVDYARHVPEVSVVSISWGISEFKRQTKYDKYFTTPPGHIGITFVVSSGDESASFGAEYPASSPNVLSVGATTLSSDDDGTYISESGWRSSTGGVSKFEIAPAHQNRLLNARKRLTPDVAYNGNPNTGYSVYSSIKDSGVIGWSVQGGTSACSPQWAGQIAIANQLRADAGKGSLDGATAAIPALYSVYSAPGTEGFANYTNIFNDVTTGFNSKSSLAAPGFDTVTGLGTPKSDHMIQLLVDQSDPLAATVARPKAIVGNKGMKLRPHRVLAHTFRQGIVVLDGGNGNAVSKNIKLHPNSTGGDRANHQDSVDANPASRNDFAAAARNANSGLTSASVAEQNSVRALVKSEAVRLSPVSQLTIQPVGISESAPSTRLQNIGRNSATVFFGPQFLNGNFADLSATSSSDNIKLDSINQSNLLLADESNIESRHKQSRPSGNEVVSELAKNKTPLVAESANIEAFFADGFSEFARDSLTMSSIVTAVGSHASAWAITFGVLAVDAVLIGYWRSGRTKKKVVVTAVQQIGPLPTRYQLQDVRHQGCQ